MTYCVHLSLCPIAVCVSFFVVDCPTEVAVSPSSGPVFVGDVITCSANGHPPPSFQWTNLKTNESFEGSTIQVTPGDQQLNYRCTAYNTIQGNNCSINSTINVQVYGSSLTNQCNPSISQKSNQSINQMSHHSTSVYWYVAGVQHKTSNMSGT